MEIKDRRIISPTLPKAVIGYGTTRNKRERDVILPS